MNIITSSLSGESISKSKSKTKLAERLGVNAERIFRGSKRNNILHFEKATYTFTERKSRFDALTEDVRRTSYTVLCSPDIARPSGNRSGVKKSTNTTEVAFNL